LLLAAEAASAAAADLGFSSAQNLLGRGAKFGEGNEPDELAGAEALHLAPDSESDLALDDPQAGGSSPSAAVDSAPCSGRSLATRSAAAAAAIQH